MWCPLNTEIKNRESARLSGEQQTHKLKYLLSNKNHQTVFATNIEFESQCDSGC